MSEIELTEAELAEGRRKLAEFAAERDDRDLASYLLGYLASEVVFSATHGVPADRETAAVYVAYRDRSGGAR